MRTDIDIRTRGGFRVTGIATGPGTPDTPLLVCLPGGSYTARYFDVPGFSLLDVAEANGFTAIALDRPGYGGSDPLPADERTFARNAEILHDAIAALWADYGPGHPGVVMISHSIGSAITVRIAAGQPAWPLLGITLHGVNTVSPAHVVGAWHSMPPGVPVQFSPEQRRMFMYGPDETFAPDAVERAEISAAACPIEELLEIVGEWPRTARRTSPDRSGYRSTTCSPSTRPSGTPARAGSTRSPGCSPPHPAWMPLWPAASGTTSTTTTSAGPCNCSSSPSP